MQLGRLCTRTQMKHVPVGPADSPDEAELGLAYSLQSNDGGRSESQSMSFTRLDLRGSRVGKDDRGFFTKRKILEVSIEFRVEVR